jgi:hypothetical protein
MKNSWRTAIRYKSTFVCAVSDLDNARGLAGLPPDLQAEFGGEL